MNAGACGVVWCGVPLYPQTPRTQTRSVRSNAVRSIRRAWAWGAFARPSLAACDVDDVQSEAALKVSRNK
eukprot:6615901-Pyramimonas_sp.AAC.1